MGDNGPIQTLREMPRREGVIAPADYEASPNTQGQRSRILRERIAVPTAIKTDTPVPVTVPAYESFTTDGTADNTETFSLSHDVIESPNVQDVLVWKGGSKYGGTGQPDSVDYANDTIDVTDSGTGNTLHVWYVAGDAATLTVEKRVPSAQTSSSARLYETNLGIVHQTDQAEQPEEFGIPSGDLQRFLGSDMTLDVYLKAPYTTRYTDPDGDGAVAENLMLNIPVQRGTDKIPGLTGQIRAAMGTLYGGPVPSASIWPEGTGERHAHGPDGHDGTRPFTVRTPAERQQASSTTGEDAGPLVAAVRASSWTMQDVELAFEVAQVVLFILTILAMRRD